MANSAKVKREVVYVDNDGTKPHIHRKRQVVEDQDAERRIIVSKFASLVWLAFGVIDILLVFRFVLKMIGANPNNAFADLVYTTSKALVAPFQTLIASPTSEGMVFEVTSLVAIIVYSLVAWVLVRLIWLLFYHPGDRVVSDYEEVA